MNNESDKFILHAEQEDPSKFIGTDLYYVAPHQFRVTVCTKLFMEGVPLDYIRKHMNHLTEDATTHYGRFADIRISIDEGIKILSQISDSEGLLETNPDKVKDIRIKEDLKNSRNKADYEAITEFLKNNKLNIIRGLGTLLKMLKRNNSPLLETELGFCAWNSIHAICERREYFSSISDFFHIGVKVPTVRTLHLSYERFKEKEAIVVYNKEVANRNPKLQLEYEREKLALQIYIEKTLRPELQIAIEELSQIGKEDFIAKYPDLSGFCPRIHEIEEAISMWVV